MNLNGKDINIIGCAETGGLNGLSPILLSLSANIPIFDCSLMCRAFPEYCHTLPVIQK